MAHSDSKIDHQRSPTASVSRKNGERLRLRDRPVAGGDEGWAEATPPEHDRVVQIDQLCVVKELDRREGERQPAPNEHRRDQPLPTEPRQLLDDG